MQTLRWHRSSSILCMPKRQTIILNKGKIINSWKWAHFEVLPFCIYAHFFNMNWIHLTFSKYTFQVAFTYSPQCYEVLCEWIWKHKHKQGPERCWYLARARIFQCLKIILPLSIFFNNRYKTLLTTYIYICSHIILPLSYLFLFLTICH